MRAAALRSLADAGCGWCASPTSRRQPRARSRSTQLRAVHARVLELLAREGVRFDAFALCLHHPGRASSPSSRGRATAASRRPGCCSTPPTTLGLDLARSWMVGDTDADVAAGRAAGCRTVLIEYPPAPTSAPVEPDPDLIALSLLGGRSDGVIDQRARLNGRVPSARSDLTRKIFADGADLDGILALAADPRIAGLHDEPDADVEGGPDRLRGVRQAPARADHRRTRSPSRCSPTTPTRCAARRG